MFCEVRIRELEEALRQRDARIADLERQNTQQASEIAELKKAIEAWKRGHRARSGGKLAQKTKGTGKGKATGCGPGRKKGHAGSSRPAPQTVDHHVDAPACTCPHCGGEMDALQLEPGTQLVEDIVPGRTETTAYHRQWGQCRRCGKQSQGTLPNGLGDNPKIGTRAQAMIVQAKNEMGLSLGRVQQLLSVHYGMTLSRGGIQQILHRAAEKTAPAIEQIHGEIAASSEAWADETSLKVDGHSGYLWLVMTRYAVLFHADPSRGTEVAAQLLDGFHGTLHSDFYAVYWAIDGIEHAPCWGHLVREARQVAERDAQPRTEIFARGLKHLYLRGVNAQAKDREHATAGARRIRQALDQIADDTELGQHSDVARLQARIVKHRDELLAFITNPALDGTNNRSEREIRPIAMARHTSGGARSERGAETFAINRSIVRTAALNGVDYHDFLCKARIAAATDAPLPPLITRGSRAPPPRLS